MPTEDKAWTEYRETFADVYDDSNYASPLQASVMRASHRLAERAFGGTDRFDQVLEIGAGTGEHLAFVRHQFNRYLLTDHDPGTIEVAKRKLAGVHAGKVEFGVQAADALSHPDAAFDRVIATHVLEHILQPHLALKEWARVVKPGGVLTVLIPTDPGFAWRMGRRLGPRRNAIARGIAYDYVMAREHVNSCNNLIAILRHYFPQRREGWWPFPVPSMDLNLFFVFHTIVSQSSNQPSSQPSSQPYNQP
jgi:phosphatidylethanolamine/phosphatidyl-N-methylethanolamine N-methyltransferase